MWDLYEHISTNIHLYKDIRVYIEEIYIYSRRWEKNTVVIIHIYGALSMFLHFWDQQDTESESWETKIDIAGPILT